MAVEPEITPSGELLYQRVLPVMVYDEEHEWFGRTLSESLMAMFQELDQIVLDTPEYAGWTIILDPERAPPAWLNWTAQIYGVTLVPNSTTEQKRARIKELPPQKRGTIQAMALAAMQTLTGAKEITFVEQAAGHPYRITAHTPSAQTPNATATLEALISQKPGGVKLVYTNVTGPTWNEATKKWHEVASTVQWGTAASGQV